MLEAVWRFLAIIGGKFWSKIEILVKNKKKLSKIGILHKKGKFGQKLWIE